MKKRNFFLETYNSGERTQEKINAFYSKKKVQRRIKGNMTEDEDQPEKRIFEKALKIVNSVENVLNFILKD